MKTAIDSNILLDIFTNSGPYADKSARALKQQLSVGPVVACTVVWAEVATFFSRPEDVIETMGQINVEFSPDDADVAIQAARAWQNYRARGGKKERLLPDFLIAAHALTQCDCLLTRDLGFYRSYFRGLKVVEP